MSTFYRIKRNVFFRTKMKKWLRRLKKKRKKNLPSKKWQAKGPRIEKPCCSIFLLRIKYFLPCFLAKVITIWKLFVILYLDIRLHQRDLFLLEMLFHMNINLASGGLEKKCSSNDAHESVLKPP